MNDTNADNFVEDGGEVLEHIDRLAVAIGDVSNMTSLLLCFINTNYDDNDGTNYIFIPCLAWDEIITCLIQFLNNLRACTILTTETNVHVQFNHNNDNDDDEYKK